MDGEPGGAGTAALLERCDALRRAAAARRWRGSFPEYLELCRRHPAICRLSHERIHDMLAAAGGAAFFGRELFGLEPAVAQLREYFASAAARTEVRRRILLLMGPVGGGKSSLVALLKRGLEAYAATDEGALYGIEGCPMHEEPLHLVPAELREELRRRDGLRIEGDLCPLCRFRLEQEWGGDVRRAPVERIFLDERARVGIGTFAPSDEKSQDISELVGSVDLAAVGRFGVESDPRAYRFDGELNVANRGLMEFVEMLKCQEQFLYGLLSLSQEQAIKASRFALIYADLVVVAHTNEAEYRAFAANPRHEALRDRIVLVPVPYNLRVRDEVRIYERLLREAESGSRHVAPHALEVAAMFAVLTRLRESRRPGGSPLAKMRLYDAEAGDGEAEARELRAEAAEEEPARGEPAEGMGGISPRYVINRLSAAACRPGCTCLTPLSVLRSLLDGLEQHPALDRAARQRCRQILREVRREYDGLARAELRRAASGAFEESARALFEAYVDHALASCNRQRLRDAVTGEEVEPDEAFLRSIEEPLGVGEGARRTFREELLLRISALERQGRRFDYRGHERLREALESRVCADLRAWRLPGRGPEREGAAAALRARLTAERGYCPVCAAELVEHGGPLLQGT
jgi:serine protein kinase